MNYDLALMALEGLTRSQLAISIEQKELVIEGQAAAFKELARLCLLLAGVQSEEDAVELQSGVHLTAGSPPLRLRITAQ
ncbi:MAG: hypothetical protein WA208_12805 [Thermoanaerobaculia bacterium]